MACLIPVVADASLGGVKLSVFESFYYVFGTVYWDRLGVAASACGGGYILCSHA